MSGPLLVRPSEADRAADVLARGFGDDPFLGWLLADAADPTATLRAFFGHAVACGLHRGQVHRTPGWEAVAVWAPLGQPTMFDEAHGALVGELIVGAIGTAKAVERSTVSEQTAANHHAGEHLYLPFVAVDPDHRSKGWGGKVLQPMLDQACSVDLPVYLESSNPRNLSFYERLGFRQTATWSAENGPSLTGMLKE